MAISGYPLGHFRHYFAGLIDFIDQARGASHVLPVPRRYDDPHLVLALGCPLAISRTNEFVACGVGPRGPPGAELGGPVTARKIEAAFSGVNSEKANSRVLS